MALLDGDERAEMPSLSWNSVVKKPSAPLTAGDPSPEETTAPPVPPVAFSTTTLTPTTQYAALAPTPPISLAPRLPPTVAQPPTALEMPDPERPTQAASEPEALPTIVEATPTTPPTPILGPTPTPADPPPAVPTAPQAPAFKLPPTTAAVIGPSHHGVNPANARPRRERKDRSASIARVGFFFLIVGALASVAVIFGRPYLFPAEWEPNALEFAEPIEVARGTEFVEPVLLMPQPTDDHRAMVAAQLLGDPASDLSMWRALGLAGLDSTDDATLQALISEQAPVLYSTIDGQVYYDQAFTRSDRAALISRAMATAALDQELAFSTDESARSLLDAALTTAHVNQQATLIAQTATNRPPTPVTDVAALAFLPAVLDYRLTAPAVFADLLPPVDVVAPNPLTAIGTQSPGPLKASSLQQIPSNSLAVGDVAVGPAVVTDRSFWFLSFASHLDAATAYRMSTQLQAAGLQMVEGSTGTCAVATFVTSDAASNATLRTDLEVWAAATAPELGASVAATPDGNVQLRSCDPAGTYVSNIRFGVARQLIAYQSVELAVTNLVTAQGGTEADVATAIARIGATPSATAVAQLPAGTSPADLAAAAQAAGNDVVNAAPVVPGGG